MRRAAARDGGYVHAEFFCRAARALTQIAKAHHHHAFTGDGPSADAIPHLGGLIFEYLGQARLQQQQRHQAGFLGLGAVCASIVGERDVLWQPGERHQRIDTSGGGLYPFQLRRDLAQAFARRHRVDHQEVRRLKRCADDLVIAAYGDAQFFGQRAMAFGGCRPICFGQVEQHRAVVV